MDEALYIYIKELGKLTGMSVGFINLASLVSGLEGVSKKMEDRLKKDKSLIGKLAYYTSYPGRKVGEQIYNLIHRKNYES